MLAIESVLDVVANVDLVNHLVSILLKSRREDDDLVVFGHRLDELHTARPYQEETVILVLYVVDQSLVQIEHQGEGSIVSWVECVQKGWMYLWQVSEVVREDSCAS